MTLLTTLHRMGMTVTPGASTLLFSAGANSASVAYSQAADEFESSNSDVIIATSEDSWWLNKIRAELYKNQAVEGIYLTLEGSGKDLIVDYWIVIPHRDIDLVRELIRSQRENVIGSFSQIGDPPFQLDFHICYREGRDVLDLLPDRAIKVPNF